MTSFSFDEREMEAVSSVLTQRSFWAKEEKKGSRGTISEKYDRLQSDP
jgi:hypothetical protein